MARCHQFGQLAIRGRDHSDARWARIRTRQVSVGAFEHVKQHSLQRQRQLGDFIDDDVFLNCAV